MQMAEGEALARVGEALFGFRWKTPLARAIGVNRLTIHRWATGDSRPSAAHRKNLSRLADERGTGHLVPADWRPVRRNVASFDSEAPRGRPPLANGPLDPDARAHLAYWLDIAESVFLLRAQTYYAITEEPFVYPDGNVIPGYRCGTLCGHCGTPFETVVAVEHMRAGTGRRYCLACSPAKNVDSDEKNALDKTNNIDKPAA